MAVASMANSSIRDFAKFNTMTTVPGELFEYLVIAGGASGGGATSSAGGSGGGGAAGGYRSSVAGEFTGGLVGAETPLRVAQGTNFFVSIGAGGALVTATEGNNGSPSICSSVVSLGGGAGGRYNPSTGSLLGVGNDGGSGGGGGGQGTTNEGSILGGSAIGQGFDGGNGQTDGFAGGGGGGAGQAGGNATPTSGTAGDGGDGGDGISSSITGSAVTRAGAGGGGAPNGNTPGSGGDGGGGGGGQNLVRDGIAGTANTGSGGGGASDQGSNGQPSGAGGSGIVIVKYPNTLTLSIGAGLTSSTTTSGNYKITSFTAGADIVEVA